MFITVRDLQRQRVEFDEKLPPDTLDLGPDLSLSARLVTQGRAELIEEHRGGRLGTIHDIRLVGLMSTQVASSCARCLEPVARDVERSFDLLYRPQGVDRRSQDASIGEADTEIGYYTGEGLLLEDVLREQVLLAVPMRAVCSEQCKGLCPHCGQNLNLKTCACSAPLPDERWAALKEIKSKL